MNFKKYALAFLALAVITVPVAHAQNSDQCNWYGRDTYPVCKNKNAGWGKENGKKCISKNKCVNGQPSNRGGLVKGSSSSSSGSSKPSSGGSTKPSSSSKSSNTVLYSENFNNLNSPWKSGGIKHGNYGRNGRGVNVKYSIREGKNSSGKKIKGSKVITGSKKFSRTKEATLLYDIKLGNDWNNSIGGKFHGLGPKRHVTGCKPVPSDKWSARITIRDRVPSLYLYYQDKKANCGDQIKQVSTKLSKNKWYTIALYVKVNDKNSKNAVARLYVDGKKVGEKKNFKLHNSSSAGDTDIQQFMLSTFMSQNVPKGKLVDTQTAYFDNVRVVKGELKK